MVGLLSRISECPCGSSFWQAKWISHPIFLRLEAEQWCSSAFKHFQRIARYDVFLAGNVSNAKLVGYRWTCGRQVVGQAKSESVQTAKVSMRNE